MSINLCTIVELFYTITIIYFSCDVINTEVMRGAIVATDDSCDNKTQQCVKLTELATALKKAQPTNYTIRLLVISNSHMHVRTVVSYLALAPVSVYLSVSYFKKKTLDELNSKRQLAKYYSLFGSNSILGSEKISIQLSKGQSVLWWFRLIRT